MLDRGRPVTRHARRDVQREGEGPCCSAMKAQSDNPHPRAVQRSQVKTTAVPVSEMPALTFLLIGATLAGASAAWLPTWLSRPVQISSAPPSPFSEDGCFNNSNECPVFSSRSSNDTVHVGYVRCLPPLNFGCPTLTCAPESCSANFISLLHNRPEDWISNVVGQVAARNLAVVSGRRLRATAHLARTAINRCLDGDIVETGVYTGGSTAVLMRALIDYDGCGRKLWAFDSFMGLPTATNYDMQGDANVGVAGIGHQSYALPTQ